MKFWLFKILIWVLVKENLTGPRAVLSKEEEDGLLSQLWENPAFRKRVADRDAKLIHTMAGGEGLGPEPRDQYALHAGQRVENLLWARDAKVAYLRRQKLVEQQKDIEGVVS